MKLRGRTLIVLIIIFAIAGTIFSLKYIESHFQLAENAKPIDDGGKPSPTIFNIPPPPNSAPSLPSSKLLPVPFTPQAPTANWDELHGEGCEEASVIMANAYYNYNDNNDKISSPHAISQKSSVIVGQHKVGRNDLCPCGSGKKYKRCHGS